jgi:hypothetical protein
MFLANRCMPRMARLAEVYGGEQLRVKPRTFAGQTTNFCGSNHELLRVKPRTFAGQTTKMCGSNHEYLELVRLNKRHQSPIEFIENPLVAWLYAIFKFPNFNHAYRKDCFVNE